MHVSPSTESQLLLMDCFALQLQHSCGLIFLASFNPVSPTLSEYNCVLLPTNVFIGAISRAFVSFSADSLTSQLMKNPEVLAALQSKLGNMTGMPSGYIQNLPKAVKRRIKALKKLQLECCNIEAKFFEEVHVLECKYASIYAPTHDKVCHSNLITIMLHSFGSLCTSVQVGL